MKRQCALKCIRFCFSRRTQPSVPPSYKHQHFRSFNCPKLQDTNDKFHLKRLCKLVSPFKRIFRLLFLLSFAFLAQNIIFDFNCYYRYSMIGLIKNIPIYAHRGSFSKINQKRKQKLKLFFVFEIKHRRNKRIRNTFCLDHNNSSDLFFLNFLLFFSRKISTSHSKFLSVSFTFTTTNGR